MGLALCSGLDSGLLLQFPMGTNEWEYAGDPVNMASKLAEECGQPGWHYHTARAAGDLGRAAETAWQLGPIELRARGLRLV